jgi:ATP-dependent RNA helicase DeaD
MGKDGIAYTFVGPDQGEPLTAIELLINKTIPTLKPEGFEAHRREAKREGNFRELYSTTRTRSSFGSVIG